MLKTTSIFIIRHSVDTSEKNIISSFYFKYVSGTETGKSHELDLSANSVTGAVNLRIKKSNNKIEHIFA